MIIVLLFMINTKSSYFVALFIPGFWVTYQFVEGTYLSQEHFGDLHPISAVGRCQQCLQLIPTPFQQIFTIKKAIQATQDYESEEEVTKLSSRGKLNWQIFAT